MSASSPPLHSLASSGTSPERTLKAVFSAMAFTMICVNFDAGATSAVLRQLSDGCLGRHTHEVYPCLTESEKGILGALPYCGLFVGCPIAAALMTIVGEKTLILLGLILQIGAVLMFTFVTATYTLFLAKFLVGIAYSALRVYAPVWVNDFAPMSMRASWLGVVQATGPLGILCGYAVSGYLTIGYQWAFRIEAALLAFCSVLIVCSPKRYLDKSMLEALSVGNQVMVAHTSTLYEGVGPSIVMSASIGGEVVSETQAAEPAAETLTVSICWGLLSNQVYVPLVFARCILFFIVTSIQYWSTSYFVVAFEKDAVQVHTVYLSMCGTAPIIGIAIGGRLVDAHGGYVTLEGQRRAGRLLVLWASVTAVAGIGLASLAPGPQLWRFLVGIGLMWIALLFGAAILPPSAGLVLQSVEKERRMLANAIAMSLYMLIGHGLGTYLPGQVQSLASRFEGTEYGFFRSMQLTFFSTVLGFIGSAIAFIAIRRKHLENEDRLIYN